MRIAQLLIIVLVLVMSGCSHHPTHSHEEILESDPAPEALYQHFDEIYHHPIALQNNPQDMDERQVLHYREKLSNLLAVRFEHNIRIKVARFRAGTLNPNTFAMRPGMPYAQGYGIKIEEKF
jgi:hypothetical protein